MSFTFEFSPNMVRDSFWLSSLNEMFKTLGEIDEDYPVELVGSSYMLVRLSDDVMFTVKLPEGFNTMTEEEIENYLETLSGKIDNKLPTPSDWI